MGTTRANARKKQHRRTDSEAVTLFTWVDQNHDFVRAPAVSPSSSKETCKQRQEEEQRRGGGSSDRRAMEMGGAAESKMQKTGRCFRSCDVERKRTARQGGLTHFPRTTAVNYYVPILRRHGDFGSACPRRWGLLLMSWLPTTEGALGYSNDKRFLRLADIQLRFLRLAQFFLLSLPATLVT